MEMYKQSTICYSYCNNLNAGKEGKHMLATVITLRKKRLHLTSPGAQQTSTHVSYLFVHTAALMHWPVTQMFFALACQL